MNCMLSIIRVEKGKGLMQLRRWGLCRLAGLLAPVVLLGMASICLAQGGIWTTKANMPTSRYAHKTCVVNGKIYAIGGAADIGCRSLAFRKVEEYNPSTDTWSTKTDMPTARESFALSAVNGKIYAIGGHSRTCAGSRLEVEEYDPQTDTWNITKAPMPTPRGGLSSAVVNGKIYAMGGLDVASGRGLKTVEEYDPVADSWTYKADMPTARRFFSTCVVDGKIYVFWGYYGSPGLTTIDVYDPGTDSWSTKDTPVQLGDCAASAVNGLIYVFGGIPLAGNVSMSDVWEYNPIANTWSSMSRMPAAKAGAPASAVNGKIYLIGNSSTLWPYQPSSIVQEYTPPGVTGVEDSFRDKSNPIKFALHQNYPNPFLSGAKSPARGGGNPTTKISYTLSQATEVTLSIHNLNGQLVRILVSGEMPAGQHSVAWNAKDERGRNVPSGIYLYKLQAGEFVQVNRMLLLK